MNSHEFFLWLNGYLEALESERVVYGPNVTPPTQQGYATPTQPRK